MEIYDQEEYRSVGNMTADTIKQYIKESHRKPKAGYQSCKLTKSVQKTR